MDISNVYAWRYGTVVLVMAAGAVIWIVLGRYLPEKLWKILNIIGVCVSLAIILKFTVLSRMPGAQHQFAWAAPFTNEFFREMFMNAFLYFPLGLTLSCLIGPWAIVAGFMLSVSIESWQYLECTGLAQGTDVLCNTIGMAVASVSWVVKRYWDI